MKKICSKCNQEKELSCFTVRKESGENKNECLKCERVSKRKLEYSKNKDALIKKSYDYYHANKQIIAEKNRKYRQENAEKIKERKRLAYLRDKEKVSETGKRYRNRPEIIERNKIRNKNLWKNKEYCESRRIYSKEYREKNIQNKIATNIRTRINIAVKEKSNSTFNLLGCNIDQFLNHLQSQFTPEMNWQNYGEYWWVDHIIPCRAFDLENPEHQKVCFHYMNCRPMQKIENIIKGNTEDKKWSKIIDLEPIKNQIFGVSP